MSADPLLTHIREARHRISANVNHDPRRLVAYYMERQHKLREKGDVKFFDATTQPGPTDLLLHDKPVKPGQ